MSHVRYHGSNDPNPGFPYRRTDETSPAGSTTATRFACGLDPRRRRSGSARRGLRAFRPHRLAAGSGWLGLVPFGHGRDRSRRGPRWRPLVTIFVDSSGVLALVDRDDPAHAEVV